MSYDQETADLIRANKILEQQLSAITAERDEAKEAFEIVKQQHLHAVQEVVALKARKEKPYAYAGEFDVNDMRDMRTVIYRELSGFKTERKQPDAIYPLYRGEKL